MNKDKTTFLEMKIYFIFALFATIVIFYYNRFIGVVAIILYLYVLYLAKKKIEEKEEEIKRYIKNLSDDFESIAKNSIFNMPFPIVVSNEKGSIVWHNTKFVEIFEKEDLINKMLEEYISEINLKEILKEEKIKEQKIKLGDKSYTLYGKVVNVSKSPSPNEILCMFYLIDDTNFVNLEKLYLEESTIIAKVEVDNFDEAMDSTPSNSRPTLIAEIDLTIKEYFERYDALVRKYDDDLYLVLMTNKSLLEIKDKKFDLLDDLRELNKGNTIPITLSIGVSQRGLSFKEAYEVADTCLDLALGRGGDQAAIKLEDNYEFFGGKSKAVEKRNKVKARVLGMALKQLIDSSKNVFIMGHKNADMDAIGSAIGVLRAALNREKEAYIVLNSSNPSIENLIRRMKNEEPKLYERIIKEDHAKNKIDSKSLLILVDNHKPSFTEAPDLIDLVSQVIIIDHHRRGKEIVENAVLTYIEPYASSTSELVTEMLSYMSNELNLSHFEADALMSGIVVDTKNFSLQTGVRTFEAASMLRRAGADMTKVKKLFEDDLDTLLSRAEVVNNTKVCHDEIAISRLERKSDNSILVAAQAADELLDINGVNASFVMTKTGDEVHISGRSRGNISVQLILEKLGGGGHLNMAGARLQIEDLDEAEEKLMEAIEEYLKENKEEKD